MCHEGIATKCLKTIANLINKHFTSVGEKLASNLDLSKNKFDSFLGKKCDKTMFLHDVELHEVLDKIHDICVKKAMGFDDIPLKIIILQVIFNK